MIPNNAETCPPPAPPLRLAARLAIASVAAVVATGIGIVDFLTGPFPDLSVLYIAPVVLAAAFVSTPFALSLAVGSILVETAVVVATGTFLGARSLVVASSHLIAHVLVALIVGYLRVQTMRLHRAHDSARREAEGRRLAQEELGRKDEQIREAYSEVIEAVTGGKLVLLTPREFEAEGGLPYSRPQPLDGPEGLADARRAIGGLLSGTDLRVHDPGGFLLAAGEALTNAVKHGRDASFQVFFRPPRVRLEVIDRGPGIDFRTLPSATLLAGFSTAPSLGMGFTIMLSVCDRISLATEPGLTAIGLEMSVTGAEGGPGRPARARPRRVGRDPLAAPARASAGE